MYAPIPMVPGPVSLHPDVLSALARDYPSGQIDDDFMPLYHAVSRNLARFFDTDDDVVLMSGEGMLALWGALKSTLRPGDAVLTVGTGVFGDGTADMAASMGCRVEKLSLPYDHTIVSRDLERIEAAVRRVRPVMITAVHCETPSGTLNPLEGIGRIKHDLGVPLFYADVVSSLGGVPVHARDCHIDLALGGSQKCLAAPPSMCFLTVSETAWDRMAEIGYCGYDAILPFRNVQQDGRCPYTPNWHGLAALDAATRALLAEGIEAVWARHAHAAGICRAGLKELGIALWPEPSAVQSPTVTAARIPAGFTWPQWREALRRRGLVVAGSFGPMAGRVFRLGHMGTQAREDLVLSALQAMEDALKGRRL
ncbi:MAG: aminotransferase class V-fold PLP-dependent enzyme [Desulfovibrio sp.]|nr:aminotransferase class V-fold PLP-dependent enzyme [Desulfovibrio sp.]